MKPAVSDRLHIEVVKNYPKASPYHVDVPAFLTVEKGEAQGFMKIAVEADTGAILGAAILGTGGDEIIHSILDVM